MENEGKHTDNFSWHAQGHPGHSVNEKQNPFSLLWSPPATPRAQNPAKAESKQKFPFDPSYAIFACEIGCSSSLLDVS